MTSFATFSITTTEVPVVNKGILNGYKVTSVLHSGRKISLDKNAYYYIPHTNQFVTFRGSRAKPLTISALNKYSMIEKYTDRRGHWNFQVDAEILHLSAKDFFLVK